MATATATATEVATATAQGRRANPHRGGPVCPESPNGNPGNEDAQQIGIDEYQLAYGSGTSFPTFIKATQQLGF